MKSDAPDHGRRRMALLAAVVSLTAAAAEERKILRLAFTKAETSLDPARIVDLYSRNLTAHIFEALYQYDHLARPSKIKPLTADGMPEASADFRVWTVKVKPGIYFADDPAFKGKPRELVAEDYVYAIKRMVDPANKSPIVAGILDTKYLGLAALREDAVKGNKRVRLRQARRRHQRDRPLHHSLYARGAETAISRRPGRVATWRVPWRARWSSITATRSTPTRSAPGRSA